MGLATSIAVYLTIWWTALFAILPLGVKTYAEMGEKCPGGGDPAAPMNPNLKRKFFTTTWVSAIIFAVIWSTIRFHLVELPPLPSGY